MLKIAALVAALPSLVVAWSPTDSYAPGPVDCPSYLNDDAHNDDTHSGMIRRALGISENETEWMEKRDSITIEHLKTFLADTGLEGTDEFLDDLASNSSARIPRIALSFSGGGYRAMLCAAGQLAGLDNRTHGAAEHGLPILDASSYIAGLSGGSWFVSSVVYNNWTSVQEIIDQSGEDDAIWDLEHTIIAPHGLNIFENAGYWDDLKDQIDAKEDAGFETSLTDPWGRGLSYQFFPGLEDFGAAMTFSGLREWDIFTNHEIPFPIIVADGRTPGRQIISANSTVFEFNPFELGSWDPSLESFVDLKYVGTPLDGGKPSQNDKCVAGLDNTGFVFGTSSTLFNQFILQLNTTDLSGLAYSAANLVLSHLSKDENDIAPWVPNPFFNSPFGVSKTMKESDTLYLVDGGEDLQNVPLYPLLEEERGVDIIFAFDNSADTEYSWPDGASLVQTYERQFLNSSNNFAFPYVPSNDTFIHNNLTAKPTFFGCHASNLTDLMEEVNTTYVPPLVVYIANRPWTYSSNASTFKLSYDDDEKLAMIENGFAVSTFNNLTTDPDFKKCIGCAILQRSRERAGIEMSEDCKSCFDEYCWDGSTYTYEEGAALPDAFTDTGVYNANSTTPQPEEIEDVNTATETTSSTATGTVSSISSTHKNDGSLSVSLPSFTNLIYLVCGLLAVN